jgi:hypothetical protein
MPHARNHSNLRVSAIIASPRQHRKLENKDRSGRGPDSKQRLRDPGGQDFVCHVHSPLMELIEQ